MTSYTGSKEQNLKMGDNSDEEEHKEMKKLFLLVNKVGYYRSTQREICAKNVLHEKNLRKFSGATLCEKIMNN